MKQLTTEDFQVIDNFLFIRLPEEIDHHRAGFICRTADRYLGKSEAVNVVFDFESTRFMDSSGIGIIMGRYQRVSCLGGKVYVLHADHRIKRVLSMAGIEKMVEVLEHEK